MAWGCIPLINKGPAFNRVFDYFNLIQWETGPKFLGDLDVEAPDQSDRFTTFLGLLDVLIAHGDTSCFLIVNHGRSDATDDPVGLSLPLTDKNPDIIPDLELLNLLGRFIDKNPTDQELSDLEKTESWIPDRGPSAGRDLHLAPGTLRALHARAARLRSEFGGIERIDIRACNLAKTPHGLDVMNSLGRALGCQVVTAPDVHMFCGPVSTGKPVSSAGLAKWEANRMVNTRQFTNPADPNDQLGIHVIGSGLQRTIESAATAQDLGWFANRFIVSGTTLPPAPAPFPILGIDLPHHSFALPQEDDYRGHIQFVQVSRTPPSAQGP
jgi:hypothetical protein